MKCPYQTIIIIHEPETVTEYAKEKTTFSECLKNECPFYHMVKQDAKEHCRKAEKEVKNDIIECIKYANSVQPKPMQVDLEADGYSDGQLVYDYGKCPNCGWDFEYGDKDWEEPYCCHCGQRLHWFESEGKE